MSICSSRRSGWAAPSTRTYSSRGAGDQARSRVLVFCGTGFAWHKSNLENFVDFYQTGGHRSDDLFGLMEPDSIKRKEIELLRNISYSTWLRRRIEIARREEFVFPVRGRRPCFPR
jgi:hypothetical protein